MAEIGFKWQLKRIKDCAAMKNQIPNFEIYIGEKIQE